MKSRFSADDSMIVGGLAVSRAARPADLARLQSFQLGQLEIRPASREVVLGHRREILEPRVMQVLVVLADARGAILSRDDLIAACWEGRAVTDHSINRVILRLRALARTFGAFDVETIIKVGYRLVEKNAEGPTEGTGGATALNGPRSTVPPNGLDFNAPKHLRLLTGRIWLGGAILAVGLTAIALLFHPFQPAPRVDVALAPPVTDGTATSKAVAGALPDRFAELLSKAGYKVRAQDPGSDPSGASFLARANMDDDGQDVHATLTLIEPDRRDILWSQEFSRPKSEAQTLAAEASSTTAAVMACALEWMSHSKHRLDSAVIKDLLAVCGLNVNSQERGEAAKRRQDLARDIVSREPDFPPGLLLLATSDIALAGELPAQSARLYAEARAMADHVLRIDPQFGGAYVAFSLLPPNSSSLAGSYAWLAKGMAISPDDAWIDVFAASTLGRGGYLSEGVTDAQRAVDLRPLDPWMLSMLVDALVQSGRIGDARAAVDQGLALWPGHTELLMTKISIEARQGDPDAALSALSGVEGKGLAWYTPTYADRTRRIALARKAGTAGAVAKAIAETEAALNNGSLSTSETLEDLIALGAVDQFYLLADKHPESAPLDILFEPAAVKFRADTRFMPLAKKLGMLQFWRARGRWPDFCLAPNAPYDCAKAIEGL